MALNLLGSAPCKAILVYLLPERNLIEAQLRSRCAVMNRSENSDTIRRAVLVLDADKVTGASGPSSPCSRPTA